VSSFASSSTLARQIEAGAPADLFISADQKWMDYAADKKAIDPATRATLLGNSLVVVAPKASAQGAITIDEKTDWTSLLKGGRLAVGDPQHVPAGIYAKEALQKLGAWETLSPKLAPAEDVRGALALVERNEAPLGIVYGSDAVASKGVKVVGTFPEASHQKVEYPLAIVDGHRNAAVSAFYDYLKGPEASAILNVTDLPPADVSERTRMAGGAAEPESLLLAVALSLPFGIFFPGCWSAHLSRQGAARQYSPSAAGAAAGGGGVSAAGGHGAARVYWQLAV
jgi:molybdate transport system substrate-binding protein